MDRFTEETAADLARSARLDRERADESRGELRAALATEEAMIANMTFAMDRINDVLFGAGCTDGEAAAYRRSFHPATSVLARRGVERRVNRALRGYAREGGR